MLSIKLFTLPSQSNGFETSQLDAFVADKSREIVSIETRFHEQGGRLSLFAAVVYKGISAPSVFHESPFHEGMIPSASKGSLALNGFSIPEASLPAKAQNQGQGEKKSRYSKTDSDEMVPEEDRPLFHALKKWRLEYARRENMPAYIYLIDRKLATICHSRPTNLTDLKRISGMGSQKIRKYGNDILEIVKEFPRLHKKQASPDKPQAPSSETSVEQKSDSPEVSPCVVLPGTICSPAILQSSLPSNVQAAESTLQGNSPLDDGKAVASLNESQSGACDAS